MAVRPPGWAKSLFPTKTRSREVPATTTLPATTQGWSSESRSTSEVIGVVAAKFAVRRIWRRPVVPLRIPA